MDEQSNWADYYKEYAYDENGVLVKKEADPELEALLAEEQAIEQQIRDAHDLEKDRRYVEDNVQALLSRLAWAAGLAVESQQAEVILAIATVVKFTRDLS